MTTVTPSRRERLRTATVAEIKQTARRLLVEGGASAISLRAIAREMGMTAPAIYRYFESLEALIAELCSDLYAEVSAALDAARQPIPADQPATRLRAMASEFRRWCINHRAEFALMFGEPVPGVPEVDEVCGQHVASGVVAFCEVFMVEFVTLWRQGKIKPPPDEVISDQLAEKLAPYLAELDTPELPIGVVYLFLSGWIRLYGMVAMEVFGHLSWALADVEPLFETDMAAYFHLITGEAPAIGPAV
ncbi:MAG TPA: TetR/AcrR family transcriptional regulator [Natronosporangium sp.]